MPEIPREEDPIIAIIGNVKTSPDASLAAVDLGRAFAQSGFRIMVYSSGPGFLEQPIVEGYVASQAAKPRSIEVHYPLHGNKPEFSEQKTHEQLFDWRPDSRPDWEMSFYNSLRDVNGVLLLGGGDSTLIAGLVAMGYRHAILALAAFQGRAARIWETLQPGRDLVTADDISLMARPHWTPDLAEKCAQSLHDQLARGVAESRQLQLELLRKETNVKKHAVLAVLVFLLAMVCIPIAWASDLSVLGATFLLFFSPVLSGMAGSTIRLVLDLRQGNVPLSSESAITTAALGLIAGGVAGTLFIAAQVNILPTEQITVQSGKLVPFGVTVGFIAGLTLDAVFRKLTTSDVLDLKAITTNKPR